MVLLLIGAGIGLVSSIGLLFVSNYVQNLGKVKIYAKIVGIRNLNRNWGVYADSGSPALHVPLWVELLNTSNSNKIVRDFNLYVFNKGKLVGPMVQINRITDDELAREGGYSFVIPPRSIERYKCHFSLTRDSINGSDFDEIKVSFYDNRDKQHWIHMKNIEDCWKLGARPTDGRWIAL